MARKTSKPQSLKKSTRKSNTPKTYIASNGYRKFKDSNTSVHRWVAEKNIGRELKSGEVVHHRNGDKLDNNPNNLTVYRNQSEHMKKGHK